MVWIVVINVQIICKYCVIYRRKTEQWKLYYCVTILYNIIVYKHIECQNCFYRELKKIYKKINKRKL